MRMSVIVGDSVIVKNGVAFVATMPELADAAIRAIQFYDNRAEIEYDDGRRNSFIGTDQLAAYRAPFETAWQVASDAATAAAVSQPEE